MYLQVLQYYTWQASRFNALSALAKTIIPYLQRFAIYSGDPAAEAGS